MRRNIWKKVYLFWLLLLLVTLFSLLFKLNVNSQLINGLENTENVKEIAQYDDNFREFQEFSVNGNLLVASAVDETYIFDITNYEEPFLSYEITEAFYEMEIVEKTLFVNRRYGLQSYDLRDLMNIQQLDTVNFTSNCHSLKIIEDQAYLIYEDGICIIDLTDANNLEEKVKIDFTNPIKEHDVRGQYLYTINEEGDIDVTNISDYSNIQHLTSYHGVNESYSNLIIKENYLFVRESRNSSLLIFNITNPMNFKLLPIYEDCSGEFIIGEELIYMIDYQSLTIIDKSNLTELKELSELLFTSQIDWIEGINKNNNALYINELGYGLRIVDCSNVLNPVEIKGIIYNSFSDNIVGKDSCVYVADRYDGIEIFELNNTNNVLELKEKYRENDYLGNFQDYIYYDLLRDEEIIYATTYSEYITILKILENNSLMKIGEFRNDVNGLDYMAMNKRFIFVRSGLANSISIIDISNRFNPVKAGHYYDGNNYDTLDVNEEIMVGRTYNSVRIFDIIDPSEITLIKEIPIGYFLNYHNAIKLMGDNLYLVDSNKFTVYDVSKPANPKKICEYNFENKYVNNILAITEKWAILGVTEGVIILEISNLKNPKEVAYYGDGGIATEAYISDNKLFIADGYDNLEILQTTFSLDEKGSNLLAILLPVGIISLLGITAGTMYYLKNKKHKAISFRGENNRKK